MSAPLRLGVVDQSPIPSGSTAADALRCTLELARACERLGYHRYWVAEHHNTAAFAGSSPEVLIPQVAAATERMRVGSGGVMLSHYAPLHVAEQFRVLEALFPGRIDLGVGRAPGGDPRTARTLQHGPGALGIEHFPEQVAELVGWVSDSLASDHPFARVHAVPRGPGAPEVWLLGSGGSSAVYAAELGCAYSYAQFISGQDGAAVVDAYRERFRPSARLAGPEASVGLSVICAETDAEAQRLATSLLLWRMRLEQRMDTPIPSPDEGEADPMVAAARERLGQSGGRLIAGDPKRVRDALLRVAEHYGVDELMLVTITHDFAARIRSYELIADALGLRPEG